MVRQDRKWLHIFQQKEGGTLGRECSTRGTDGKCALSWEWPGVRFARQGGVGTGDRREEGTVEHHINAKKGQIRKCGVKKEKQKGKTGSRGVF